MPEQSRRSSRPTGGGNRARRGPSGNDSGRGGPKGRKGSGPNRGASGSGSSRGGKPGGGRSASGGPRRGSDSRRGSSGPNRRSREEVPKPTPRAERSGWGSVAQHGAIGATIGQRADDADAAERFSPEERRKFEERQARRAKAAERTDSLRGEAKAAIDRSASKIAPKKRPVGAEVTVDRRPLPGRPPKQRDIPKDLNRIHGATAGQRQWRLFTRAAREYENEQFEDARRTLKPLVDANPGIPEMRELFGLSLYRLGKWELAIEQLEQFRTDSGTAEQHPPLMDAHRALGHWADVDALWIELGELSPAADLVVEGRIVRAGAEADQGRLDQAIRILEKGWKVPHEPQDHHLRRAYALADLFERVGSVPRARKLFAWVERTAPGFGDAGERAHALD